MRKLLLYIILLTGNLTHAQRGLFVAPNIGLGASNSNLSYSLFSGSHEKPGYVFSFEPQINLVFMTHHLQLRTGLGYLRTGYTINTDGYYYTINMFSSGLGTNYLNQNGNLNMLYSNNTANKFSFYYSHIMVPFCLGYEFGYKKISIVPLAGIEMALNTALHFNTNQSPAPSLPDNYYKKSNIFATFELTVDYHLNNKLCMEAGPAMHYMLNSVSRQTESSFLPASAKNYAVLFNAGFSWKLSK